MKHFPINLVAFSWILVGKMVLYPSKFILLLSSYIKSSVKLRGPVPETVTHAHANTSTRLYRGGCMLEIICSSLFFSTFLLSHHLSKGSSLSHQSINSSKTLLAHFCAFFTKSNLAFLIFVAAQRFTSCRVASVILCQSLLMRVDCQSIAPAFWKLLVILQTCLLGFLFTAFMICLSSTAVVFSGDQVVVGCWCRWWFPNSWFLHALCFCLSSNWLPLFF